MLLHRLFLLVMLIDLSWSDPKANCEKGNMACFLPKTKSCTGAAQDTEELMHIAPDTNVGTSCEAIVKIRSYTKQHYLIRMESYDSEVTQILLVLEPATLECNSEGGKVVAKFNDVQQDLIEKNTSPLSCEFYVKDTSEVFNTQSENIKLSSSKSTTVEYKMEAVVFIAYARPTCDRENVKYEPPGASSDKIFEEVDAKLAKLKCRDGFKLMFNGGGATQFTEASSIICEKESVFGYRPAPITPSPTPLDLIEGPLKAYCEATTCKLCDASMAPTTSSGPSLEVKEEGGCKMLKCAKGRMKLDSQDPAEGSAQCQSENNKAVWKFNGQTIKKDSTVLACVEKMDCSSTEAAALCPDCSFDLEKHIPACFSNKKLQMEGENVDVEISCNTDNGKFKFAEKGGISFVPPPGKKLACVLIETPPPPPKPAAASTGLEALPYVFAALAVIVLIVGAVVGYRFYMKKKQRKATPKTDLNTAKESKSVESKSKESKSANDSKKPDESKKEETAETTAVPPTVSEGTKYVEGRCSESTRLRIAAFEALPPEEQYRIEYGGFSGGQPSTKKEETVRRNSKNKKKEKKEKKELKELKDEKKVYNEMLKDAKKLKKDCLKGKDVDPTQQSGTGGQSEGKDDDKDKTTAVIPSATGV